MENITSKCPKCGVGEARLTFALFFDAPIEYECNMSKSNIKKSEVKLTGADWSHNSYYRTELCGYLGYEIK